MATSHIDIVQANFARRRDIQGELRELDENATHDNRSFTDDETARFTELRSELEQIDSRIEANLQMETRTRALEGGVTDLLGMMVDRDGDPVDTRSIGERFVSTDAFHAWAEHRSGTHRQDFSDLDLRAVTDTTSGATSGGAFATPTRLDRVGQDNLDRRVFLIDQLPRIAVSTGVVEYVQDESPLADMADKAAEVTEGDGKPQAGITTRVVTESPATIAAWVNITRQVAADAPQVVDYLNGRLRYSLTRRCDAQAITGNGTPPNLTGLAIRSGIITYAPGTSEARYASIRHAIQLMESAEATPEIIVLNPVDAERFDLSNAAADGLHAVPNVAGPGARTAWGLRQVRSTVLPAGTALLIDPMTVAVLDRMGATAYMTDSHASQFTSNILTLLLEVRLGLALFDPAGVCKVTFNGTT